MYSLVTKLSYSNVSVIQCKCYVNSCWSLANSSFAFWNFLKFFFQIFFHLQLVESADMEPTDLEGLLYMSNPLFFGVKICGLNKCGAFPVTHRIYRARMHF